MRGLAAVLLGLMLVQAGAQTGGPVADSKGMPPARAASAKAPTIEATSNPPRDEAKPNSSVARTAPVAINGEVTVRRSEQQAAWEMKDGADKGEVDQWTLRWAGTASVVALLALFVAMYQAMLFRKQLRLMAESLKDANAAAQAALKSAELAERAYTNLERPYVYVFGASKFDTDDAVAGGFTRFVRYNIANYGKTPAVIRQLLTQVSSGDAGVPEDLLEVESTHEILQSPVIEPGGVRDDLRAETPGNMQFDSSSAGLHIPEVPSKEDLYVRIVVRYDGPFSKDHETSACWRYDESLNALVAVNNLVGDYNYTR